MGLSVVVTDYTGAFFDRVDDPKNILHRILPPGDEESASVLSKIDWYGDTYFNYIQLGQFMREWDQLRQRAETSEDGELIERVMNLARRCREDRSLLRFIGD
jgi:hypothetical protein